MIAEALYNVVFRLEGLEDVVSPEVGKVINLAISDLIDTGVIIQGLERQQSLQPAGLAVSDPDTPEAVVGPRLIESMGALATAMADFCACQKMLGAGGRQ
jgi:hypothetical protein